MRLFHPIPSLLRSLALAPLSVAFFACSSADVASPPIAQTSAPIIHGTKSTSSQDMVVLIGFGAGGGWYDACSGVLVAPNLLLTARHCISDTASHDGCAGITGDIPAEQLRIYTGPTRTIDWISNEPQAYGKQTFHDNATSLCGHDIGLVLLDRSLEFEPIAPVRLDAPPNVGDTFTAVGWGVTETTDSTGDRMQRTDIPIVKVDKTSEFEVGESICEGDSGGPALSTTTGAVLGVVARGGGGTGVPAGTTGAGCVDPGVTDIYTGLWGFKALIQSAFDASGYSPWIEGTPDPRKATFGAPCYNDNTCQSDACVHDPVAGDAGADTKPSPTTPGWCSQACDDATPCPAGYDCTTNPEVADAGGTDAGAPPKICTKHVDAPPPTQNGSGGGGGGCAIDPHATSGEALFPALAMLGLAAMATRRRR
jgi:hypothetical protein